jgi:DNA-binding NarL/FixJ family response regulator
LKSIRVLLADELVLVRSGIRALIERKSEIVVVAEADNGREALRLMRESRPHLVLMDITMPALKDLEQVDRITKEFPGVPVIILSRHDNEEYVREAVAAGAVGYVLKRSATAELESAIKAVARGETYFSREISGYVTTDKAGHLKTERGLIERLTPRQRQILQLIAERHHTKEIAQILDISVKTVETHRAQLMERLGIHDVPGLVRFAIKAGLVSLEE